MDSLIELEFEVYKILIFEKLSSKNNLIIDKKRDNRIVKILFIFEIWKCLDGGDTFQH